MFPMYISRVIGMDGKTNRKEKTCCGCGIAIKTGTPRKRCPPCASKAKKICDSEYKKTPEYKEWTRIYEQKNKLKIKLRTQNRIRSPKYKEREKLRKRTSECREKQREHDRKRRQEPGPRREYMKEYMKGYYELRKAEKIQSQLTYLVNKLIAITKEQDHERAQNDEPS